MIKKALINTFTLLFVLVGLSACNDKENDIEKPLDGDVGLEFCIYVSFIDKVGNDIIESIEKTPMTLEMSNYTMITDSATYFKLEDYQMETYLNGEIIEPAEPFKHNFVNCLSGEASINGKTAIVLVAPGPEQQLKIFMKSLNDIRDFGKQSIEWHFSCPKLFGDNLKHIFKLDFDLIVEPYFGGRFQGQFYLDGVLQELYYPEYFGISPTYHVEGRDVYSPYCIINL